jgi:hypothetical protein
MSYDSNEIDRWYEHRQAELEAHEMDERERQKELQVQKVLNSMTNCEYKMVMELHEKLREAAQNSSYQELLTKTEEEKALREARYYAALSEFNKRTEKWPVLRNGF